MQQQMHSTSGTFKISVRRSNDLPTTPIKGDEDSVYFGKGVLTGEDSLDTLNYNNLPITQEPSRISITSHGGLGLGLGIPHHHIDHEFGFEVLKLNKAEAVRVAQLLENELSQKVGSRTKQIERRKWQMEMQRKKEEQE